MGNDGTPCPHRRHVLSAIAASLQGLGETSAASVYAAEAAALVPTQQPVAEEQPQQQPKAAAKPAKQREAFTIDLTPFASI